MSTAITRAHDFTTDRDNSTNILAASVDAEFDTLFAAANQKVQVKATAPSGPADGDTWVDIGQDPPVLKIYDLTGTAWVSASQDMSDITTAVGTDEDLADAMENYLDGCYVYRVDDDTVGVSVGSAMINGKLRRITSALTADGGGVDFTLTASKWNDVWALADASATTFTISVQTNQATPSASSNPGTSGIELGSIYADATTDLTGARLVQYRPGKIIYIGYITGGGAASATFTIVHGKTFAVPTAPRVSLIGDMAGTTIAEIDEYTGTEGNQFAVRCLSHTTTQSVIEITEDGTISNGSFHGFIAVFEGRYT